MWGRHCGGLGMRLTALAGLFPGAHAPCSTLPAGLRMLTKLRGCAEGRPLLHAMRLEFQPGFPW